MRCDLPALLGTARLRNPRPNRSRRNLGRLLAQADRHLHRSSPCVAGRWGALAQHRRRLYQWESWLAGTRQEESEPCDVGATGQSARLERQGAAWRAVAPGLRVAGGWLVSSQRHHLAQAQRDAGKRQGPANPRTRVFVHAHQERALRLLSRGCDGGGGARPPESPDRVEHQHGPVAGRACRFVPARTCPAVHHGLVAAG